MGRANRGWLPAAVGFFLLPALLGAAFLGAPAVSPPAQTIVSPLQTIFVVWMADTSWRSIKGSSSAPYINSVLLPQASHAEQYFSPTSVHPGELNAIWLEAGANALPDRLFNGDWDPDDTNSSGVTDHLVSQLSRAGLSWRSYQEDITGFGCPIQSSYPYIAAHNPMLFFRDVTESNHPNSLYCEQRVRPISEIAGDLARNSVATYNFVSPNACNDMRDSCEGSDRIQQGDAWLGNLIPRIQSSLAYQASGAVFIVWDQAEQNGDGPVGMIVLSPLAKGNGYASNTHYDHSSTLLTIEEAFGLPPLGAAAKATDLSDLFSPEAFTTATQTQTPTRTPTTTMTPTPFIFVPPTQRPTLAPLIIPPVITTPTPTETPTATATPQS